MSDVFKINLTNKFILTNLALLMFVLSIPGTIALRNILALTLLITLVLNWLRNKTSIKLIFSNSSFRNIIFVLLSLSIYIFFHSLLLADEVKWSLSQYRSQWIYPMLYFSMGILLAFHALKDEFFNQETLLTVIFYALLIHIIFIDLVTVYRFLQTGRFMTSYGGLTESPVLANYLTNILNSIIIAEIVYRLSSKRRIIQLNIYTLLAIFMLCIFSSVIESMRFGVISLFFLSLTGSVFFIIANKKIGVRVKCFIALSIVIACSLPLLHNAQNDSRWSTLLETIPIAIDTETNLYWQGDEANIPKLSNGENVSHSNYMRIAWAKKGVEYISKDIFGIGYGRNVFGHAIEKYDGSNSRSIRGYHSHSALIDFTIGVGLLGLILWLYFQSNVIFSASLMFINKGNYFSLLSVFIASGFLIRSIVDANMRDHMFKQFFLILGVSLTLAFYENNKKPKKI